MSRGLFHVLAIFTTSYDWFFSRFRAIETVNLLCNLREVEELVPLLPWVSLQCEERKQKSRSRWQDLQTGKFKDEPFSKTKNLRRRGPSWVPYANSNLSLFQKQILIKPLLYLTISSVSAWHFFLSIFCVSGGGVFGRQNGIMVWVIFLLESYKARCLSFY